MKFHKIIHQPSCPYTSQQDGDSWRKNKHLIEIARTLLIQSHVPLRVWDAVLISSHLVNHLPSSAIQDQVPHSIQFLCLPLFSLPPRIFGSMCFVHNLTQVKSKLAPHALEYLFLSYPRVHKRYQCYSTDLQW